MAVRTPGNTWFLDFAFAAAAAYRGDEHGVPTPKRRKALRQIRMETKLARLTSSVENANMSAANESNSSSSDDFLFVVRFRRISRFPVFPIVELKRRVL